MANNPIMDQIHGLRSGELQDNPPIFVLMNWLYQCDNELQILLLNELVNSKVFKLTGHNILLQKLLQQCIYTTKLSFPKKVKQLDKIEIVSRYYGYSKREVKDIIKLFSDSDIEEMIIELDGKF